MIRYPFDREIFSGHVQKIPFQGEGYTNLHRFTLETGTIFIQNYLFNENRDGSSQLNRLKSSIPPFGTLLDRVSTGDEGKRNMKDIWVGRRAHPRLDVNLPVHLGLIDIKQGGKSKALFSGETTDVSMQGLGIRMNSRISQMIPIAIKLMGDKKTYNLRIGINLGGDKIQAVGEVKWSLLEIPHQLKMGVFIKGMGHEAEGKWTSFIENKYQEGAQDPSPSSRASEFIQIASNHLEKASNRICRQMKAYQMKSGK
jgi:hypothetical protein